MPVNREQVVQAAEKLVAKGKIEAAIKEYRKVLEDSPSDTTTLNRVGDLWARLNKNDEAIKVYTQTAASFSDDGFFVKAIAIYKKVIKLDPTRLEVYEKLADLYHRQGLTNEARTQYQVLIDYYLKHSNAASAISILLKMVQLEPENPTHHVKLADIYKQQKLIDKAMGEYKVIAELMLSKGHADEAAQVYLKALDVNANDMAFLTEAVLGLRDGGHVGPAARLLAAAVEKNPQAERVAVLAGMRDKTGVHTAASLDTSPAAGTSPPPPPTPPWAAAPAPPPAARVEPPPLRETSLPPLSGPESSTWNEPFGATDSGAMPPIELDFEKPAPAPAPEPAPPPQPPLQRAGFAPPREESFAGVGLDDEFVLDLDSDAPLPTEFRPPAIPMPPPVRPVVLPPMPPVPPVVAAPAAPAAPTPAQPAAPLPSWSQDTVPPDSAEAKPFELDLDLDLEDGGWAADAQPASAPSAGVAPGESLPDLELPQEIEWSFDGESPAAPAPPTGVRIDAELLERTAAEVHPPTVRRDEDLVAEAEVFAKYGLQEKAEERLREALAQNPRHAGAQALLISLMVQQGRHDRVVQLANHLAETAVTAGQHDTWAQTRQKLVKQGYRVEGDRVIGTPKVARAEPDRIADLLDSIAQVPAAPAPAPAAKAPRGKRPEAALEDIASAFLKPAKSPAKPKPAPAAPASPASPEMAAASPSVAPAPPPMPPAPSTAEPSAFEEVLPSLDDELEGVIFPQEIAAAPGTRAAPPSAASPPPPEASLSWLDEIPAAPPGAAAPEEKLFDDEEDFFDLAAELERELVEDDGSRAAGPQPGGAAPQEQSLEEIVEGFKKGVAENLSPEDYDTHFNLGIAYREMGLLDEAIGEFQLASKDVEHLVECCSMLGICFLDKGLPELAVKWYKRGLEVPNLIEDRQLGLLYDMGNALALAGDRDAAYKTFVEIYGINSNYRDIVAILQELGPR